MDRTPQRNAVLLYVNLRRNRLAVVGDDGVHACVGQNFWDDLVNELKRDMRATHYENAISTAVLKIGQELARHFPVGPSGHGPDVLKNFVTED